MATQLVRSQTTASSFPAVTSGTPGGGVGGSTTEVVYDRSKAGPTVVHVTPMGAAGERRAVPERGPGDAEAKRAEGGGKRRGGGLPDRGPLEKVRGEAGARGRETNARRLGPATRPRGRTRSRPLATTQGALVNEFALLVMVVGIVLQKAGGVDAGQWIFYFGFFGFAGGITNWIAIKMLFDEIPGVYGSGIIPKQFKQIRTTIKRMVMETFFEPKFLEKQLRERLRRYANGETAREAVGALLSTPEFDKAVDDKLASFGSGVTGTMLKMLGLDPAIMKPYVKPFVEGVAEDCAPYLAQMLSEGNLPVLQLRDEVDKLMEERLKELTADKVKALVEDILREHLGWLVVWGVIFGVLIGVVCIVAGF